jgi:acyl carrier protein
MTMTDKDYIELLNGIIQIARPVSAEELKLTSLDVELKDTGLDSLDFLMVGVYLSEIFGVSEEDMKEMKETTVRGMLDYMLAKKTKEPESVASAIDSIR